MSALHASELELPHKRSAFFAHPRAIVSALGVLAAVEAPPVWRERREGEREGGRERREREGYRDLDNL